MTEVPVWQLIPWSGQRSGDGRDPDLRLSSDHLHFASPRTVKRTPQEPGRARQPGSPVWGGRRQLGVKREVHGNQPQVSGQKASRRGSRRASVGPAPPLAAPGDPRGDTTLSPAPGVHLLQGRSRGCPIWGLVQPKERG